MHGFHTKLAANFATLAGTAVPPSIAGMVRIGQTGEAVRRVQKALNLQSGRAPILVDGIFGRGTEVAVQQFQAAHDLRPDGAVGPITAKALGLG
ncbi:peptidoglycan-binding domain-containing protein [Muricoccus radiodurans]|uniref:peptidoglycan-binding domain-containing protein n=1 Tax=Muricoccus radiodurans TaxID=2231721 RepID=UPI003CE6BFA0